MMVSLFSLNVSPFCQRSKDVLLPKKHLKMTFPVFSSDRKMKDDKKVYSVKYASRELV